MANLDSIYHAPKGHRLPADEGICSVCNGAKDSPRLIEGAEGIREFCLNSFHTSAHRAIYRFPHKVEAA